MPVYPLQNLFSFSIVGMGLSGKDNLDRPPRISQDFLQAFGVLEYQVSPLVARKPPGKTDGKYGRVQHQAVGN